jgi:hypothetical protein
MGGGRGHGSRRTAGRREATLILVPPLTLFSNELAMGMAWARGGGRGGGELGCAVDGAKGRALWRRWGVEAWVRGGVWRGLGAAVGPRCLSRHVGGGVECNNHGRTGSSGTGIGTAASGSMDQTRR